MNSIEVIAPPDIAESFLELGKSALRLRNEVYSSPESSKCIDKDVMCGDIYYAFKGVVDDLVASGKLPPKSSVYVEFPCGSEGSWTVTIKDPPNFYANFAALGYEGYAEETGGKPFDGRDMPKWDELPDRIQKAWIAAARGIIDAHVASALA